MLSSSSVTSQTDAVTPFDKQHWPLTVGILLAITLNAFEALAIVTIAPRIAEALGGMVLYGWIFSGFMLASLLGIVAGGHVADKQGPTLPFATGLALFGLGLFVSGFAPTMLILIVGRVIQGLGGGAFYTAIYAGVNVAYPDAIRPRVIALMSTAWVVPALLGPALAGFLSDVFSWRIVFWGMAPFVIIVLILTVPAFRHIQHNAMSATSYKRLLYALVLVIGTGLFLSALTLASVLWASLVAVTALVLLSYALKMLMPPGTFTLSAGLPSLVAARGFFYAAFIGVEVFLALMLSSVHGFSASVTGLAIATGAISWTAASWTQDRWDKRLSGGGRSVRILLGTIILASGLSLQMVALFSEAVPLVITIIGWGLGGFGIGFAHSTSSVLAFALAPKGEEGQVAAALNISDVFMAAMSAGIGGALFAFVTEQGLGDQLGIAAAFGFSLMLVLLSVLSAYRIGGSRAVTPSTV